MNVSEAMRRLKAMEKRAIKAGYDTAQSVAAEGLRRAQALSSGPYSQAKLTAMGHPYAVRHKGKTYVGMTLPPEVINAQSGAFKRDWKTAIKQVAGSYVVRIINENQVAEWLRTGTSKMIARPLDKELLKQMEPIVTAKLKAAQEALKP